ncbi:MAG: hypothetical protein IKU87_02430 [Clostridia bacterium]|nr:hypothetical protein [Clostridia bacterium]
MSDNFEEILGLDEETLRSFAKELDALNIKKLFGLPDSSYFNALAALRDKYIASGTKAWEEYTKKIQKYENAAAKESKNYSIKQLDSLYGAGLVSHQEYIKNLTAYRDSHFSEGSKKYLSYTEKINKARLDYEIEYLDFCRKAGVLSEEEYYQELKNIRDNFMAVGSSEWQKYNDKINGYAIDSIKSAYDEMSSFAENKLGELEKRQESFYNKLKKNVDLMHDVIIEGYYPDGALLRIPVLSDLTEDNEFLRKFEKNLNAAYERIKNSSLSEGAAATLFDSLLNMDAKDAADFAYLLANENEFDFNRYIKAYEENLVLLERVSKNPFEKIWEDTVEEIETHADELSKELVEKLSDAGFVIPEEFLHFGENAAESFKEGFLSQLGACMEEIKSKISYQTTLAGEKLGTSVSSVENVFSPTYNLYGSGETDIERIRAAKALAERERMAGGY